VGPIQGSGTHTEKWDLYREGQVSALNRLQNRAAKFAHNTNETGCETLAQRRRIARKCALFKAYTGRRPWKAVGDRLLKPCYLSRVDHNRKIRTRKQRTDVGKYSFVNRTIQNWNQLPAGLLASFPCKLSYKQSEFNWGLSVNKGSDVKWCV
jgi:hypothetical protein